MSHTQNNPLNSQAVDAMIVIMIVTLFVGFYFLFPLNVTFTLMLLVGTWWIDAYLKKALLHDNTTAFADLSFAAMIFVGSRGINIATETPPNVVVENDLFTQITLVAAVLGFVWLGNLSVCRGLQRNYRIPILQTRKMMVWAISFFFALFSVCTALYANSL